METLSVHLFKDSFDPFIALLNEHEVRYSMREAREGLPMASSGVIEILQSAAIWGSLASVVIAFIKSRRGRKVILTTKENAVVHAEGLSMKELEQVLAHAKNLTAIDSNKQSKDGQET